MLARLLPQIPGAYHSLRDSGQEEILRITHFFFLIKVIVQRLQIPTSLCGPWRDRGRDKLPTVRHVLGFLPTVQAPAARGGIHSWKGITRLKSQDPALPFKYLRS